jgi:hypothetical protein
LIGIRPPLPRSKSKVIQLIRRAFWETLAPGPDEILHCAACELWLESFLPALPEHWQQLRDDDIDLEYAALTAVKPKASRFLLPAYLIWHLRNYDCSSSNTVGHLIWQLTRTEKTDIYILECYEGLSSEQVRAVAAFLSFMVRQDDDARLAGDAAQALSSYWAKRCVAAG